MAKPSAKNHEGDEAESGHISQAKRPEAARFLVRVDQQTKASYETAELAAAAGLEIKAKYPVVQVSVFDAVERTSTVVQLPSDRE